MCITPNGKYNFSIDIMTIRTSNIDRIQELLEQVLKKTDTQISDIKASLENHKYRTKMKSTPSRTHLTT